MLKIFKEPRFLLMLILSLTLISAELDNLYPHSIKDQIRKNKTANILLIGTDARPNEINARSDTIILVSINQEIGKVILLWIPRDTQINFAGKTAKINMVNQLKGPEALCDEVGRLLGVKVNHYVLTNFTGFEKAIDNLGGLEMESDIDLRFYSTGVFISKGQKHLTGKQALAYARFRGDSDADIGRTQRQQKLIKALKEQIFKPESLPKLPEVISQLQEYVYTNISFTDMVYLANVGYHISGDNIITQTLPGHHYVNPYTGGSYWLVDYNLAHSIIESLFKGHNYEVKT